MKFKERPILFSVEMVRAILDGTKTQTRRRINPTPATGSQITKNGDGRCATFILERWAKQSREFNNFGRCEGVECRYGLQGDSLWVKETHIPKASGIIYAADFDSVEAAGLSGMYGAWKASRFMQRKYSRIQLEITGIRVERLNEITEADAKAEGVDDSMIVNAITKSPSPLPSSPWVGGYRWLWESINGPGSWAQNPWVWVIEFKRIAPASV